MILLQIHSTISPDCKHFYSFNWSVDFHSFICELDSNSLQDLPPSTFDNVTHLQDLFDLFQFFSMNLLNSSLSVLILLAVFLNKSSTLSHPLNFFLLPSLLSFQFIHHGLIDLGDNGLTDLAPNTFDNLPRLKTL